MLNINEKIRQLIGSSNDHIMSYGGRNNRSSLRRIEQSSKLKLADRKMKQLEKKVEELTASITRIEKLLLTKNADEK